LIVTITSEHKELVILGQFVFHDDRVGYLGKKKTYQISGVLFIPVSLLALSMGSGKKYIPVTIWSSGPKVAFILNSKSPRARDKAKLPLTLPYSTNPPAATIRRDSSVIQKK